MEYLRNNIFDENGNVRPEMLEQMLNELSPRDLEVAAGLLITLAERNPAIQAIFEQAVQRRQFECTANPGSPCILKVINQSNPSAPAVWVHFFNAVHDAGKTANPALLPNIEVEWHFLEDSTIWLKQQMAEEVDKGFCAVAPKEFATTHFSNCLDKYERSGDDYLIPVLLVDSQ